MKVLLVGGPLDGHQIDVTDAQVNFISPQDKHQYVRALPGIFMSVKIPQKEMLPFIAQKLIDAADMTNRVGMALTQLDDAAMYLAPTGETAAEKAVHIAQKVLNNGSR